MMQSFQRWLRCTALVVLAPIIDILNRHHEEILNAMATQEERLQTIFTKVSEAVDLIKTLKDNNPDIEDEITEIENKLAEVGAPPAPVE